MSEICEIKDGAIFISDAHENVNRTAFLSLLQKLDSGEIKTPQLFLMGDIFDFLTGYGEYTCKFYTKHLKLIDKISAKTEIFFIEGNHDFRLKKLFKNQNIKVYEISDQPVKFRANSKSIQIAHGDIFLPFISKYALLFLRLKFFLIFMNFLDKILNFKISKWILSKLTLKKLDYKIKNFKDFITPKMSYYTADIVIEGHYHQGKILNIDEKIYVNLPCFASKQSYFIVEYRQDKIEFVQKT